MLSTATMLSRTSNASTACPIHLCGKARYLTDSVKQWLQRQVTCGN
jgi:hypothetical protein